jgi:hypothetical protein
MLEINCQHWINNYDLTDFSDSIANSGCKNISRTTWNNACEAILDGYKSQDSNRQIITSTKSRRQVIAYFQEFGAWTKSELNIMSNIELSALALQYIAGNYRQDMASDDDLDSEDYQSGYFWRLGGDPQEPIYTTLSN